METAWKVILIGESGVGKTALFNRYLHRKYNENEKSTISPSVLQA